MAYAINKCGIRMGLIALATVAAVGAAAPGVTRANPHDPLSNPQNLAFTDVQASRPDFKEPFLRDGVVSNPARLAEVKAGIAPAQVQTVLGQPLQQVVGSRGTEWDYNFKFLLPQSQNYLVCQYKVVFESGTQAVRETVWRRRQCQQLAGS